GELARQPPALQMPGDELTTAGVLVCDEDPPAGTERTFAPTRGFLPRRLDEAHGEPEGRAAAGAVVHADLAAHDADEALGNRQAEAGSAVAAGGRAVGLAEGFEQPRPARLGNADARIANLAAKAHALGVFADEAEAD